MNDDLELYIGDRYSILTMIFFIPYIIFQFPANIIIRKLGPAVWLPSLVIAWGAVTVGMGFATHWTHTLGCRIILGVLEVDIPIQSWKRGLTFFTGRIFPWLCLSPQLLVHSFRDPKTLLCILSPRTPRLRFLKHPSLGVERNERPRRPKWLAMDLRDRKPHSPSHSTTTS